MRGVLGWRTWGPFFFQWNRELMDMVKEEMEVPHARVDKWMT
jgi:hypothetical protein